MLTQSTVPQSGGTNCAVRGGRIKSDTYSQGTHTAWADTYNQGRHVQSGRADTYSQGRHIQPGQTYAVRAHIQPGQTHAVRQTHTVMAVRIERCSLWLRTYFAVFRIFGTKFTTSPVDYFRIRLITRKIAV